MSLSREVDLVQNTALGAVLQWKFCQGFSPDDVDLRGAPLPLMFLVLPICYTESLCQVVTSTQQGSGLRKFEEKLRVQGADRLWGLSDRAIRYRELTRKSLAVALATRLIRLDVATATAWVVQNAKPKGVSTDVAPMLRAAQRLGVWCSAHSLDEVGAILRMSL